MTVDQLMSPVVVTTHSDRPLGEVRCNMVEHKIRAVPVVDIDQKPIGILTSTDLLHDLVCDEMRVALFPKKEVLTIARGESANSAAKMMRKHAVHHLVVTEDDKVVGIISSFDLLEAVC